MTIGNEKPASCLCPQCGSGEIVRCSGTNNLLTAPRARCIKCNYQFLVHYDDFARLRGPDLVELQSASWTERLGYMFEARMTGGQVVITAAGAALGAALSFWLDATLVFLPSIFLAWWLGRLAFPWTKQRAAQRRAELNHYFVCPECGYSLIGLGDRGRCPECGSLFSEQLLTEYWTREQ